MSTATPSPDVILEEKTTNYYLGQSDENINELKGVATLTDIKIIDENGLKVKKERIKRVNLFKTYFKNEIDVPSAPASAPVKKPVFFIPYEETLTYMVDYQDGNKDEYRFSYVIYKVHKDREANKYQKLDMKRHIYKLERDIPTLSPSAPAPTSKSTTIIPNKDPTKQFAEDNQRRYFETFFLSFKEVLANVVDKDKGISHAEPNNNGDICKYYRTKGSFAGHQDEDYVYTLFRKKPMVANDVETYEYLQAEFEKHGDEYDFTFKFVPADFT